MPTLLTETILQTVVSVLDAGMAANIYRGRVDPLQDSQLPAVGVYQGAEQPADEDGQLNNAFVDELLNIRTEVADRSTSANIETALNELRRQVHILMIADDALSLSYVINIIPAGVDEPVIDGNSEKYTGTMVLNWIIHYRHQRADAGLAP